MSTANKEAHQVEQVELYGVKDGVQTHLGMIAMPPRMKAREIAREQFGHFDDGDGSDAELCFGALEQMIDWMFKQGFQFHAGATPAAQLDAVSVEQDAERYRWLRRIARCNPTSIPFFQFPGLQCLQQPEWGRTPIGEQLDKSIDGLIAATPSTLQLDAN